MYICTYVYVCTHLIVVFYQSKFRSLVCVATRRLWTEYINKRVFEAGRLNPFVGTTSTRTIFWTNFRSCAVVEIKSLQNDHAQWALEPTATTHATAPSHTSRASFDQNMHCVTKLCIS